jgi:uncharacterized protein YbjT (DUF2867 family)
VIATGARPGIDLSAPLRVDALAVGSQVRACEAVGVKQVVLVSSLCAGMWGHVLNLFGLILVVKRLGERALERSSLDWTIIRPGGLSESETDVDLETTQFSTADQQQDGRIPRRLVARVCLEALETPLSQKRIIEITSSPSPGAGPGSSGTHRDGHETRNTENANPEASNADGDAVSTSAKNTTGLLHWLTTNP